MERLGTILQTARVLLREAQSHQVAAHKVHPQSDIIVGDDVLLSTKHLPASYGNVATDGSRKLQHAFAGPFKVLSMRGNAATLELSRDLGIDPTQNVGVTNPDPDLELTRDLPALVLYWQPTQLPSYFCVHLDLVMTQQDLYLLTLFLWILFSD